MPSSTSLGLRPNSSTMVLYSSSVRATSRSFFAATAGLTGLHSLAGHQAGSGVLSIRDSNRQLREGLHHRFEEAQAVGAAQVGFGAALGVRHHAEDVALSVHDPGDVLDGSVGIC